MKNNKKPIDNLEDFVEYKDLTKTKEDKLLNWLEGEKQKEHINTEKQKKEFIEEIKNELGKEIKNSKTTLPKVIKRSFYYKLKQNLLKFIDII